MLKVCKANDRGSSRLERLDSKHTFSFGYYYDADHLGFETLRVINEDKEEAQFQGKALQENERAELKRLRRENKSLRMGRH